MLLEQPKEKIPVLLVDDQQRNLDVLRAILGGLDYHLVEALSGAEALASLQNEEFAVALHIRKDFYQAETRMNLKEISRTSSLVSKLTGRFGVRAVPARGRQQGRLLAVSEIALSAKKEPAR